MARADEDVRRALRYTDESSTGVLLAQWSGECESPMAFWKERGSPPEIVTGGYDISAAPESVVLGWSPDDRAIVHLGDGLCGSSGNPPGIYSFTNPGAGTLLFETSMGATADIWP